jgi:hypothetical protein
VRAFRAIALAGAALAIVGVGVGTAMADPASTPPAQSIVAVGSDTLTPVFDQFSTDYNATSPAPSYPLYSWDATGTTPIQTKNNTACSGLTRPNGSGAGIDDVSTSPSFTSGSTTYKCEDVARASRALVFGDPTNMAQDIIAEDLVSYSYLPTGNIPSNLSLVDLQAIFSCNAGLIKSSYGDNPVTLADLGLTGSTPVMPVIPQSNSGTRASWMGDLGLSNTTIATCVQNGSYTYDGTAYPVEENEGTNPVFNTSDNPDAADVIFPYSGGDYVCYNDTKACQATQFGTEFDSGSLVLGDIAGTAPLTGTAPNQTINVSSFDSTFDRGLYVDFISSGTGSDIPTYLQALLGTGTKGSGWICKSGGSDLTKYGFATTKNCGSITLTPTS